MAWVLTATTADSYGRCRLPGSLPRPSELSPRSSPLGIFSLPTHELLSTSFLPFLRISRSRRSLNLSKSLEMQVPKAVSSNEMPRGIDATNVEEYTSQAKLLQEFTDVPSIDKAWTFASDNGNGSWAMFSIGQANLLANKKKTFILSSHISEDSDRSACFQWSPFPIEMIGVSTIVPSPSGSKLLVVRNKENGSATQLEIWGPFQLQKEICVPQSIHGPLYTDGWFEGISWNHEETLIAYVAEEASPSKPSFDSFGFKKEGTSDKDCGSWKGQGDWEEDWGETYSGKMNSALFVVNINSGKVQPVEGIAKSLSVGQVVWAPSSSNASYKYLVFVGWASENGPQQASRKLGIKYCYNRRCALYAVRVPAEESGADEHQRSTNATGDSTDTVNLTESLSSAFFPRFSPDGKSLVFLSAKSAVDSGAHSATNSLHKMDWPADGKPCPSTSISDLVPVVMCAEDDCFPGLYCSSFLSNPWLSDSCTMVLSSFWGSMQVILLVNVMSCSISRISPTESSYSWNALAVDGDNIIAVSSSPVDPPQIKYGCLIHQKKQTNVSYVWHWLDVSSPLPRCSEKVRSLLASLHYSIMKIPISDASENLTRGARRPYEAIFVSSFNSNTKELQKENQKGDSCNPLIVILHGGPHSVSLTSYSKNLAFLASLGYSLLIVNYRGSVGFGEEALQSLPGKIGFQDVNDVLAAMDLVIEKGLADPSKVAVLGGSHGGFLTTHLIGQAPDRFAVAAVRNPVCNLSLMVGTSDIPDWCYIEAYGTGGKNSFTEAPSMEHLCHLYTRSPISHLSKVKAPVLFLLGAQDRRVPVSNGLQYARALKEKGTEVKVIVFPNDVHSIERPQSDFESFLNTGVWFKKYLK